MAAEVIARDRPTFRLFESGFARPQEMAIHADRMIASRKRLDAPTFELGLVHVIHGANEDVLPLGGQQIGRVRHELFGLFNITPDALAIVKGHSVPEDYLLKHGETLEFVAPLGRKGVGRVWTKEEFCALFKMKEADFEAMTAKGLPLHAMEDGSMRITETQVDRFLDEQSLISSGIKLTEHLTSHFDGCSSILSELRRIADSLEGPSNEIRGDQVPEESPYLNIEQAARYLRKSPKAIYGLIERGRLKKLPGSYVCLFTRELLDKFLQAETTNARSVRSGRRKKG